MAVGSSPPAAAMCRVRRRRSSRGPPPCRWPRSGSGTSRPASGSGTSTVPEESGFGYAALSPDGRRHGGGRLQRAAHPRRNHGPARTDDRPARLVGHPPAFSPDGTLVAMPDDNAVAIFEVATGRRLHHDPSTPVGYLISAAWAPSGDRFVTGHTDGFVRVWDAASGRLVWHRLLAPAIGQARRERPCEFRGLLARRPARRRGRAGGTIRSAARRHRRDLRGRRRRRQCARSPEMGAIGGALRPTGG